MSKPLISIVLPVRNGASEIADTVASILAQTYGDFELLVIDDGSTDDTAERVGDVGDPRVRLTRLRPGVGITRALNEGIARASGSLIARHDCGDVSSPRRLEEQVALLDARPDVGAVGASYWVENHAGVVREVLLPAEHEEILERARAIGEFNTCHGTMVVRAEILRELGGYRLFPAAQDQDMWWRLAESCRLANVAEPLYKWSMSSGGISVQRRVLQHWCSYTAYLLAQERREGREDALGRSPSERQVERLVEDVRGKAPREKREALQRKLYNFGCNAMRRDAKADALRMHWRYFREGGPVGPLASFWLRSIRQVRS